MLAIKDKYLPASPVELSDVVATIEKDTNIARDDIRMILDI